MAYDVRTEVKYSTGKINDEDVLFQHTLTLMEDMTIQCHTHIFKQIGSTYNAMRWGGFGSTPRENQSYALGSFAQRTFFDEWMMTRPDLIDKFTKKLEKKRAEENEETG